MSFNKTATCLVSDSQSWFAEQQRAEFGLTVKIPGRSQLLFIIHSFPSLKSSSPCEANSHFSSLPACMCCSNSFPRWRLNCGGSTPPAAPRAALRFSSSGVETKRYLLSYQSATLPWKRTSAGN